MGCRQVVVQWVYRHWVTFDLDRMEFNWRRDGLLLEAEKNIVYEFRAHEENLLRHTSSYPVEGNINGSHIEPYLIELFGSSPSYGLDDDIEDAPWCYKIPNLFR